MDIHRRREMLVDGRQVSGSLGKIWYYRTISVFKHVKAAQSVTFDLLILELMFLFFKNTVKN